MISVLVNRLIARISLLFCKAAAVQHFVKVSVEFDFNLSSLRPLFSAGRGKRTISLRLDGGPESL